MKIIKNLSDRINSNEDLSKLNSNQIELLEQINSLVFGTKEVLYKFLEFLGDEFKHKNEWIYKIPPFFELFSDPNECILPEIIDNKFTEIEKLEALYTQRIEYFFSFLNELDINFDVYDGNVKSPERAARKVRLSYESGILKGRVTDLIRFRIVVKKIADIKYLYEKLLRNESFKIVNIFNLFNDSNINPYKTNFRALVIGFSEKDDFNKQFGLEIQFLTEASNAVGILNHPFDLSKKIKYESEIEKSFMDRLMIKVAIYDLLMEDK